MWTYNWSMNLSQPLDGLFRRPDALILSALSRTNDGLTGRGLQALTGSTSRSSSAASLARLVSLGLVHRTDIGSSSLFAVNRQHVLWPSVEAMLEARTTVEGLASTIVSDHLPADAASLSVYGSTVRHESTPESDLDLVLVVDDDLDQRRVDDTVDDLVDQLTVSTGNTTHVVVVSRSTLTRMSEARDALVDSWRREGRTIFGEPLLELIGLVP